MRIHSIAKLIEATSQMSGATAAMEDQIYRIAARLNSGIDLDNRPFAPYKNTKVAHKNSRPLERAARLFEGPHYDTEHGGSGLELKATIFGNAAKIARYQNEKRRFIGYSQLDREEVREKLKQVLVENFKRLR